MNCPLSVNFLACKLSIDELIEFLRTRTQNRDGSADETGEERAAGGTTSREREELCGWGFCFSQNSTV